MSDYNKEKFLSLKSERQVKLCLDLIYKIEKLWDFGAQKQEALKCLVNYLTWLATTNVEEEIRVHHLISSLRTEPSLRKVLNVAIALERYLNISVKDDAIVVTKLDKDHVSTKLMPLYIVLDNLRSAFNVGSIFRTAECLGISHIYLVGYTPTPHDSPVQKTAMGTDELVSWTSVNDINDVINELKSKNITMVGMETSNQSRDLFKAKLAFDVALFFGNERFGLEPSVLEQMDQVLEIPMAGCKNSLNVSNAFAISAAEILRSWRA